MSGKILIALIIIYFFLLIMGGLVFHYLETVPEEYHTVKFNNSMDKIKELVASHSCLAEDDLLSLLADVLALHDAGNFTLEANNSAGNPWDITSSMFFVATLATTIGYGNMAPVTSLGRAFCTLYAFITIPVCLVMLGGVGHSITQMFNRIDDKVKDKMDKCNDPRAERWSKSMRSLMTLLLGLGLFLFLPAAAFAYMEEWTYPDALYYVLITLTTVGLGDMVAGFGQGKYSSSARQHQLYQLSVALWIIFGLAWLSTVIAMAQDFFQSLVEKMDDEVVSKMKMKNISGTFDKVKGGKSKNRGSEVDEPAEVALVGYKDNNENIDAKNNVV